jgi:hypothetical protein
MPTKISTLLVEASHINNNHFADDYFTRIEEPARFHRDMRLTHRRT